MDNTNMIRLIAGAGFVIVLLILIMRRRKRVN
jgi:LPXTG-motif cell wall-anchored protein